MILHYSWAPLKVVGAAVLVAAGIALFMVSAVRLGDYFERKGWLSAPAGVFLFVVALVVLGAAIAGFLCR